MITVVTVWLCLISHVACDVVITVNNNGDNSTNCCVYGTCPCSSLTSALHDVSDNTVINITSESVTLHDIVGMGSGNLSNIIITGNGATIMCNNTGGVYCESCSDITIMGITWCQCGRNDSTALAFINLSSEILIQDCTFQNCPVYIQNSKGNVLIKESRFIIGVLDFSCKYSTGLYISYDAKIIVVISNSNFDGSDSTDTALGCICHGAMIEPSNDVFEINQFLFENTNISSYSVGLSLNTSGENAVVKLLDVNVCDNRYGIIIYGGTNCLSGLVDVSSATFIDNSLGALSIQNADAVNISSATFMNNQNVAFEFVSSIIDTYDAKSDDLLVDISNSNFYNNLDGVVQIIFYNSAECASASIVFTNVTIYKTSSTSLDTGEPLYIEVENTFLSVVFKDVTFMSNHVAHALYIHNKQSVEYYQNVSIQLANCTFDQNYAYNHMVAMIVTADGHHYNDDITIELNDCNFDNNCGGESIVFINVPLYTVLGSRILDNSTFSNNKGTALHLITSKYLFKGNILFINNSATNGAAMYVEEVVVISFDDNANVQFINNSAELKGGAMYINLVSQNSDITGYCDVFYSISNTSNISFTNNSAGIAGDSIYFSIPQSCPIITDINNKSSLLYYPNIFNYLKQVFTKSPPIVTSPYNIKLYPPAIPVHNSNNDYFIQESKMLGEPIQITASVLDYFNNITEPVTFFINCVTCGCEYILSTHLISVHNHSIYELNILPTVAKDVANNKNLSITFLSALSPIYRQINALLSIELSSCRAGYFFDNTQGRCICYPHSNLVHCKEDYVEIKIGYWIGNLTEQCYTSSICPNDYCSSEHTETSPGYYSLHGKSDDQCSSHRTGVACGKCKSGYTLAYDSPDCINKDKCSAGITILVIVLTILYWIVIVAAVFGIMYIQFQISSGYAYGIIYFYSIVDILLVNDVSEEVYYLGSTLSSFAKLTPPLFGELCLVKGLSGIDQQFIHYSHALAVSLILLIIVLVTKYSPRLTLFVGRCVIRVICLLLLLSYTCLASTSLQLLRPLTFNDVDEVRTYLSPDIKYFTGRHLAYAIVAILCEVIIVIGLPLFLLLEPFLRRRVNLVRIKPLLDQFQGCYKDKYRWFAAYYLICRQVIILIVYVGNGNYYYMLYGLQTACVIIAMIHGVVQPYKNNLLNVLDEVILVILVLIVNLNLFSLSFIPTTSFSVVLVILPLLVNCFIAIKGSMGHFFIRKKRKLQLYNPVGTHEENDRNSERR